MAISQKLGAAWSIQGMTVWQKVLAAATEDHGDVVDNKQPSRE